MSKEQEFRNKLKIDNDKIIEDFIRKERIKVVQNKKLSNDQKKERVQLLDEALEELEIIRREEQSKENLRRISEEVWEK